MNNKPNPVREIVSESNLTPHLLEEIITWKKLPPPYNSLKLNASAMTLAVKSWQKKISQDASKIAKTAIGSIADLADGCIYRNLDNKRWRMAASLVEIFRNPTISKNAGRLDTHYLQQEFYKQLEENGKLSLVIAWGQSKRDAGGLKTLGPLADMSEVCAVITLATIVQSAEIICHQDVQLTVLTGGSRYYEALFTSPMICRSYDNQRQRMTDTLCGEGKVILKQYSEGHPLYPSPAIMELVEDEEVSAKFNTVLLNIDWTHLFSESGRGKDTRPHGIVTPPSLCKWLKSKGNQDRQHLIRTAILGLLNPRSLPDGLVTIPGDENIVDETLSFMQLVTWESTRKYIALQYLSKERVAQQKNIQLTVHEKKDLKHIPAIFTLGSRAGNLLSQHVLTAVNQNGSASFLTFAELQKSVAVPVYLEDEMKGTGLLLDWLAGTNQPLCFVDPFDLNPQQSIARVFFR
ncbi:hypothetical protein [Halomonas llamarensis]|uniref:Uncharacterized protein n=1 Tax=Halomonas llamarensis TaxID=2945104 RepID=A0ABT0SQ28_9GAMM|nr:hypothetical protein [Halomonas llamarensis]MCL7929910.1 hypothetical protein [Halomonas llamarensis]